MIWDYDNFDSCSEFHAIPIFTDFQEHNKTQPEIYEFPLISSNFQIQLRRQDERPRLAQQRRRRGRQLRVRPQARAGVEEALRAAVAAAPVLGATSGSSASCSGSSAVEATGGRASIRLRRRHHARADHPRGGEGRREQVREMTACAMS